MSDRRLFALLAVFLLMGELAEIKQQTLNYGEYVQQYAIVHLINGTADYYILCPDCIAYITIKSADRLILDSRNMTKLDDGLYGFLATPSYFQTGIEYRAYINMTSAMYGDGMSLSTFTINNATRPGTVSTSQAAAPASSCGLSDPLQCVTDGFTAAFNLVISPLTGFLDSIGLMALFSALKPLVDIAMYLLNIIVWWLNFLRTQAASFIANPVDYLVTLVEWIIFYEF